MNVRKTMAMMLVCGGMLVATGSIRAGDPHHAHAEIGKAAPAIELLGIDGKTYKLSDFKGKVVVLEWTNHNCPFVKRAHKAKLMKETLAKFAGKPVAWMAIDSTETCADQVADIKAWAKENGIDYPILLDPSGRVGHAYGALTTPHMFIIDQKGNLAYTGAVDDEYEEDGDGSRNYVAQAVTALLKGSTVPLARTKSHGCSVKYKK
ncbi:MAG: thioredoxin family protein [Phycisphaerae bacterium]